MSVSKSVDAQYDDKARGKRVIDLFSNGSEYEIFMAENCFHCEKYVHYEAATDDRPVCPIEERMALADRETFPYEHLQDSVNGYTCTSLLWSRREQLIDKLCRAQVPGHGPDLGSLTDEQLEQRVALLESAFQQAFEKEEE